MEIIWKNMLINNQIRNSRLNLKVCLFWLQIKYIAIIKSLKICSIFSANVNIIYTVILFLPFCSITILLHRNHSKRILLHSLWFCNASRIKYQVSVFKIRITNISISSMFLIYLYLSRSHCMISILLLLFCNSS